MPKLISAFVLTLFVFSTALCQKKGEINTYYLNNSGAVVLPENAAFIRVVLPPDSSIDKMLYVVCEYYLNGKIKLVTGSKTDDPGLLYQGNFISYFLNGKRKKVGKFGSGKMLGNEINYYPNGKFYSSEIFYPNRSVYLESCQDSLGNILSKDGKGKWINYSDNFKEIISEGNIENGLRQGEWFEFAPYVHWKKMYEKGSLLNTVYYVKSDDTTNNFIKIDKLPQFPGGQDYFIYYLVKNIRYPVLARRNNQQGRVIISFFVEKDGSLIDLSVVNSVSKELDEEALRVMRLSPKWNPALSDGKPVRMEYNVPIAFTMDN